MERSGGRLAPNLSPGAFLISQLTACPQTAAPRRQGQAWHSMLTGSVAVRLAVRTRPACCRRPERPPRSCLVLMGRKPPGRSLPAAGAAGSCRRSLLAAGLQGLAGAFSPGGWCCRVLPGVLFRRLVLQGRPGPCPGYWQTSGSVPLPGNLASVSDLMFRVRCFGPGVSFRVWRFRSGVSGVAAYRKFPPISLHPAGGLFSR